MYGSRRLNELQVYASTQINLRNLILRGKKKNRSWKNTYNYLFLYMKFRNKVNMVYRHYGINNQKQKEVGIMVSSRSGWIWGVTHRASRAPVNVVS